MSSEHSSLENELRNLRATAIDARLAERLQNCVQGTWTRLDLAEQALESRLRAIAPAGPSPALRSRLEDILAAASAPPEETIVPLPAPRRNFRWSAAAAVVALCGALAALLVPMNGSGPRETTTAASPAPAATTRTAPATHADGNLIAAGYSSDLSEASDQGVVWQDKTRPHRVVRVVYMDHITLKDKDGRTYVIEKPRVEYVLVPTRTD